MRRRDDLRSWREKSETGFRGVRSAYFFRGNCIPSRTGLALMIWVSEPGQNKSWMINPRPAVELTCDGKSHIITATHPRARSGMISLKRSAKKMNPYWLALIFGATLTIVGCDRAEDSEKSWAGVIAEDGGDSKFRFILKRSPKGTSGFISVTETDSNDVEIGELMEVAELEVTESSVSFVLPITGEIDEDSVEFHLEYSGTDLIGTGREMRKGAEELPTHLIAERTPPQ